MYFNKFITKTFHLSSVYLILAKVYRDDSMRLRARLL